MAYYQEVHIWKALINYPYSIKLPVRDENISEVDPALIANRPKQPENDKKHKSVSAARL